MDRSAFEYLFIHANSLAELGLRQGLGEITAGMADSAMPPPLNAGETEEQREEQQAAQLRAMMHGAAGAGELERILAGADQLAGNAAFQQQIHQEMLAATGPAGNNGAHAASPAGSHAAEGAQHAADLPDFDHYLQQSYAAKAQLAALIDTVMTQVDVEELETLLDCLPQELPSITQALTGQELAQWLDCYRSEDFALQEIVSTIRAHMPANAAG